MNGTEWTEPGQGATLDQLYKLLPGRRSAREKSKAGNHLIVCALSMPQGWYLRTNLRLTGAPLTADDLERIAKCK